MLGENFGPSQHALGVSKGKHHQLITWSAYEESAAALFDRFAPRWTSFALVAVDREESIYLILLPDTHRIRISSTDS